MNNFLDEFPQDWSNPEYMELSRLLVNSSGTDGLTFLKHLADNAGIEPGTFPVGTHNLRETCESLINVMGLQEKLRTLVEKAALEPTRYKTDFSKMLERPGRQLDIASASLGKTSTQGMTPPILVDLSRGQDNWWSFRSFVDQDSRISSIKNKRLSIDNASVLILALPYHNEQYTQIEVDHLDNWVQAGGGLLLLGYYAADTHHLSKPSYMARKFGFEFNNDLIMPASRSKEIYCRKQGTHLDVDLAITITNNPKSSSHPVLSHINEIAFLSSCSVTILPHQKAEYLLESPQDSTVMKPEGELQGGYMPIIDKWNVSKNGPVPVLAARDYGEGKVVVVGTWKICTLDYKDNRLLVNNILDWLSKPVA